MSRRPHPNPTIEKARREMDVIMRNAVVAIVVVSGIGVWGMMSVEGGLEVLIAVVLLLSTSAIAVVAFVGYYRVVRDWVANREQG